MVKLKAVLERLIDGEPLSGSSPFLGRRPNSDKLLPYSPAW